MFMLLCFISCCSLQKH